MNRVLVTGGAGYVGSHACKALAKRGYIPVVYDDYRRGNRWAVRWGPSVEAPLEDRAALVAAMRDHRVSAVLHFAAYAYVGESMQSPSIYFRNNAAMSINLLDAMVETGVKALVLSSTCATYGIPAALPITEQTPLAPVNPYGASKVMLEQLVHWYGQCHGIRHCALRYFNAAGADTDGEIGELHDPEPHLIPLVVDAALGRRAFVSIYGTDYPTADGTAVRDYVHVADLADAHVLALRYLQSGGASAVANLGTGCGASIREVIDAVSLAVGQRPGVIEEPRRHGDPPALVADPSHAQQLFGWRAARSDLATIAASAVRWQRDFLPEIMRQQALPEFVRAHAQHV